jgi:membrane-associated protease RseP (regulator of RpoE activity)
MAKRPLGIVLTALVLLLPATASVRAGDGPDDRVIVLPDVEREIDLVDADNDDDPVVVHIDHRDRGRGYLGVRLLDLTPELREYFGVAKDSGVLVASVEADSPSGKAGLKAGDVVTAADGGRIDSPRDLSRAVRKKKAGDTVTLDFSRDRAKKQLKVTVAERPAPEVRVGDLSGPMMRKHAWAWKDKDFDHMLAPLEGIGQFEQRLDELEKRLKDLEKKLTK